MNVNKPLLFWKDGVMLEKVEVDLNLLLNKSWFVALCSDSEMLLLKND